MLQKLGLTACHATSSGPVSLDGVLPSAIFDLDATLAGSYPGTGQVWTNLVAVPADGSSAASNNFHLGVDASADATDPAFSGSAGSPAAYFSFDGGDYFYQQAISTYISNGHRTDISNPLTFAIAFNTGSTAFQYIMGIGVTSGGQGYGIRISSSQLQVFGRGDSANISYNISAGAVVSAATDYLLIVSMNVNAGTGKYWLNNRAGVSFTPLNTTPLTSPTDTNALCIGAGIARANPMPSGTKIYHASAFNAVLNDASAGLVFDHLNARHGRTYA